MNRLLYLLLLQLVAVSTLSQSMPHGKPDNSPTPPDLVVQNLYRQVITHHPLGIPSGENWRIFGQYLSKGLLHKISLARSCQSDWVRQNGGQRVKEPFAWGETGFFSGDEELSEPSSFQIERTESNPDGSFRVYVKLTESASNEKPWSWTVAVRVTMEERHPVIDDVVYLKGEEVRAEYRLSKILTEGCDGTHWVGYSKQPVQSK
jgi:hypothetical protein